MLKVGLTGGIATGKSVVAGMLRTRGCTVFSADRAAHEQIAPGGAAYDAVIESFGEEILALGGGIDRARLGRIVFTDPARLEHLNSLVHPHVLAITEDEMHRMEESEPHGIFVAVAALHIEIGYHRQFDKLVVTWCTREQQLERLAARPGMTPEDAERRLNSQMPADLKKGYADYVVDCSGTLERTEEQVERLCQDLRRLAAAT